MHKVRSYSLHLEVGVSLGFWVDHWPHLTILLRYYDKSHPMAFSNVGFAAGSFKLLYCFFVAYRYYSLQLSFSRFLVLVTRLGVK